MDCYLRGQEDVHRELRFEETVHYRAMCAALLLWWVAFMYPSVTEGASEAMAGTATEQGSLFNQLTIFALTGMGILHLPHAWRSLNSSQGRSLVVAFLLYCGWSGASLSWSIEGGLTIRRLSALILMLIGCWGVGAGFYARTERGLLTLGRHMMYATVIAAAMLLPPRLIGLSLSDILSPTFNLKETTRAAALMHPAGYAVLAAIAVFEGRTIQRWAALCFFFGLLVFMKGRTMMGDVLASATLLASRLTPDRLLGRVLMTLGVIQTAFYGDLGTGGRVFIAYMMALYDALAPVLPWITLGGGVKDLTSLNGRLPLWTAIYDHISMQPWTGYGFGAFWTSEHLNQVFRLTGWHAVVAHNGFLDELLATGVIGLILFLSVWIYGMRISLQLARNHDRASGYLMFCWLILYLLFNTMDSVNQAFFKTPFFVSAVGMFTVAGTLSEPAGEDSAAEPEPELVTIA